MPFWRTLKVTKKIEHHRLLHPDRPPVVISREQLARVHQENAYQVCGRTIDVRKIVGVIFDYVFKCASAHTLALLPDVLHWACTVCCSSLIHLYSCGRLVGDICRYRWFAIGVCLLATAVGTAGTIALEAPPTSEPPIFDSDHNVQVCDDIRSQRI